MPNGFGVDLQRQHLLSADTEGEQGQVTSIMKKELFVSILEGTLLPFITDVQPRGAQGYAGQ